MKVKKYEIKNPAGIHIRPAGKIAELCRKYEGNIKIRLEEGLEVNAKSVMGLIGLGIPQGEIIEVIFEGSDEESRKFFEEFDKLVENNFYDNLEE